MKGREVSCRLPSTGKGKMKEQRSLKTFSATTALPVSIQMRNTAAIVPTQKKGKIKNPMKERIKKLSFITAAVLPFLLISCSRNNIFSDTSVIPGKKWALENVLSFSPEITDTISSNDILFMIRTGSSYPFRNIFLFVTTKSPEGKTLTDTVEYALADEKGNRYGRGFGDIRNSVFLSNNTISPVKVFIHLRRHGMRSVYWR